MGLAPVPALDTQLHLTELLVELGPEEVLELTVVLRRGRGEERGEGRGERGEGGGEERGEGRRGERGGEERGEERGGEGRGEGRGGISFLDHRIPAHSAHKLCHNERAAWERDPYCSPTP